VKITRSAQRAVERLQVPDRERVEDAIEDLGDNPRPFGSIKLVGRDLYRIRVADYRIVYTVDDAVRVVRVERVGHRDSVYREL